MTIYNVSIQLGLLEFLKLMMGILQYQPTSEKTFLFKPPLIMEITVKKITQHVTNTFLYQYPELSGSYAHNTIPCRTTKTLCRSLDVPSTQLNEKYSWETWPSPKFTRKSTLFKSSKSNARIKSTDLTTAWTCNKLFTLECNQKIPNWTGFRKLTSLKVSAPIIIGNCRTIPA